MAGVLTKHAIKVLVRHQKEMQRVLTRKDYNMILCRLFHLTKRDGYELLKELRNEGYVEFNRHKVKIKQETNTDNI